jgi:hypothetical protein
MKRPGKLSKPTRLLSATAKIELNIRIFSNGDSLAINKMSNRTNDIAGRKSTSSTLPTVDNTKPKKVQLLFWTISEEIALVSSTRNHR